MQLGQYTSFFPDHQQNLRTFPDQINYLTFQVSGGNPDNTKEMVQIQGTLAWMRSRHVKLWTLLHCALRTSHAYFYIEMLHVTLNTLQTVLIITKTELLTEITQQRKPLNIDINSPSGRAVIQLIHTERTSAVNFALP